MARYAVFPGIVRPVFLNLDAILLAEPEEQGKITRVVMAPDVARVLKVPFPDFVKRVGVA